MKHHEYKLPISLQREFLENTHLHASIKESNVAEHSYVEALENALINILKQNKLLVDEHIKLLSERCPQCVINISEGV